MEEAGRIIRVNGPIVKATGMVQAEMYEVVEVGPERLVGEVIRLEGDTATIEIYENTSGLKAGGPVYRTGMPLSVTLAPGLIGNIYDGIQRPLPAIARKSGYYIERGEKVPPLDTRRKWHFKPLVKEGDEVLPGTIFGTTAETGRIEHRFLVPPRVSGKVLWVAPEGEYPIEERALRIESNGKEKEVRFSQRWPVRVPRPVESRMPISAPLITGLRIIDTFFPLGKGGAAAIPGGFGTGKTMTQHSLAKWSQADVIVYIGCGERGNEMTQVLTEFPQLVDPSSGKSLMERTIMIANTSNMPVAAREVSIYTGITLAEYYRDMGYDVAVMADSTSRWAEALRELAARLEEMPTEEGFPAYLPTSLASFYERAGMVRTLSGRDASVTVIGSISPPGGDFSEPVTQHTKRFIRCFWALDTDLANARHYPSIHWLTSYSEYLTEIQSWWGELEPEWLNLRNGMMELLQREDRIQQIAKLVGPDVLPESQRLVLFVADVIKNAFLQQNAFDKIDMHCAAKKQVALLRLLMEFYEHSSRAVEKGVPLEKIRTMESVQSILRAKSEIPNEKSEEIDRLRLKAIQEIEVLARSYG